MPKKFIVIGVVAIVLMGVVFGVRLFIEDKLQPLQLSDTSNQSDLAKVRKWFNSLTPRPREEIKPPMPAVTPPPPVYQPVQWPASSTIDWELRKQLPKELVDKIDQSPVPVLIPGDVEVAKKMVIYIDKSDYMIDTGLSGLEPPAGMLDLSGRETNFEYEQAKSKGLITHIIRGMPGRITVNGEKGKLGIVWIENNSMYEWDLPCKFGCEDKRSEAWILELANNLKYVGGARWNDGK